MKITRKIEKIRICLEGEDSPSMDPVTIPVNITFEASSQEELEKIAEKQRQKLHKMFVFDFAVMTDKTEK